MKFYKDELYIKMCSKANLPKKKFLNGDQVILLFYDTLTSNVNTLPAIIWGDSFNYGICWVAGGNNFKFTITLKNIVKIEIKEGGENENISDREIKTLGDVIWLPRQDQLQEMIWNDYERRPNMKNTEDWIEDFYLNYHNNWKKCFDDDVSMERLWLIHVMDKKFHKTWNGETWI